MDTTRTDEEIIEMVHRRSGAALAALAHVIYGGKDYPGPIEDIYALLDDTEEVVFGLYSPSDLAWAYLVDRGLETYEGDRWQVAELLVSMSVEGVSTTQK